MNSFAQTCIRNKDAEGFNFAAALTGSVFETCGDGYWSDVAREIEVKEMGMFVNTDGEEYGCGDFYVLYEEANWNNDTDGLIYTDSLFLEQTRNALKNVLVAMGFEASKAQELAESVNYSEQGMQDYGRVSFDAYELADALRKFYTEATA